jgi:hypothetical protein
MTMPNLDCRPGSDLTVQVEFHGHDREAAMIIDDFLADAEPLVEYAASQCKFTPVKGNLYPGIRGPLPNAYMRMLVGCLQEPIARVFGLSDIDLSRAEGDFSIVTTPPDQLSILQCLPHFDTTDPGQVAVLHYLCRPEQGGTSFYRQRSTGFESIDAARQEVFMVALNKDIQAGGPPARNYMQGDSAMFERIGKLEAAFNRLVIYRSATLHSGDIPPGFAFDPDPRTGRLTANAFLHFRRKAGA